MNTEQKPWIEEIDRFYSHCSAGKTDQAYNRIFPGTYMYLVNDEKRSVRFLADRFDDATVYRRGVAFALRCLASVPSLLRFVPGFDRCSVSVVPERGFDVAILGSRTKLLSWEHETAITLSNGYPEFVRKEIEVRRKLPSSVQVPKTIDANGDFPYLIEQLIDGTPLGTPRDDWPFYRQAFLQLRRAYEQFPSESVPIDHVLSEVEEGLRQQGLLEDEMLRRAVRTIEQLELPESLSRGFAHGDVFGGNLLRDGDRVLILDWAESSFDRFQFGDFVHPLLKQFGITGDADLLVEVFADRDFGAEILGAYANDLGESVWESTKSFPGCVLLYPLTVLADERYSQTYSETTYYGAIAELLNSEHDR